MSDSSEPQIDLERIKVESFPSGKSSTFALQEQQDLFALSEARNLHVQKMEIREAIFKCALYLIKFVIVLLILFILIRTFHLLAPGSWHWLSKEDVKEMDKILGYVIIGAIGTQTLKYYQKMIFTD